MYICNTCGSENPFLIFEYNELVCEKCSFHKNISNCNDLNERFFKVESQDEEIVNSIGEQDAEELLVLLEGIKHPRIREDFLEIAEQYIWGDDSEEDDFAA